MSQALFSMTMHARAAQLAMAKAGVDDSGPLGRSVAQLAELARGALAEMRALIFELRPGALAEEGLVAALAKQAAALSAREQVSVSVEGPISAWSFPPRWRSTSTASARRRCTTWSSTLAPATRPSVSPRMTGP